MHKRNREKVRFGYNQIMLKIIRSKTFFIFEVATLFLFAFFWIVSTLPGFYNKLGAIGYAYCHQIPSRSFVFGNNQFAFCHRCTGLFLGILFAFIWQLPSKRAGKVFTGWKITFSFFSLLFYIVDALNGTVLTSFIAGRTITLYPPSAMLRTVSGLCLGSALGLLIYPIFNNVFWTNCNPNQGTLGSPRMAFRLLASELIALFLVFSENPIFLTIFDILSTLSAILFTACLYLLLILLFFRLEIRFNRLLEGRNFLLLGVLFAAAQITVLAFLRFRLTGMWYWPI